MLVERDIDAFLTRDWEMVEDDFIAEGFFGCMRSSNRGPTIGSWRFRSSYVIATNGCDRRIG
jgi:hypothetical protein